MPLIADAIGWVFIAAGVSLLVACAVHYWREGPWLADYVDSDQNGGAA